MDQLSIYDLKVEHPKVFEDNRGKLLRMLRNSSPLINSFGEFYFSYVNEGIVKGWKKHIEMTQLFSCPFGEVRVMIFDDRESSKTAGSIDEVILGESKHKVLRIPPGLWYSFASNVEGRSLLANFADMIHDDNEVVTKSIDDSSFPSCW